MELKLPAIDGLKFSKGLAIRRGSRGLAKFLDMVGPTTCQKLVENHTPLAQAVPPEVLAEYVQLAQQWHWVANLITDQEFETMLPPWFLEIVRDTPGGPQWLRSQIVWLRSLFVPPR
jgi:hypothetical protein